MNLVQLENLFIEKLTEKYKLTQRDIKRAFSKFDTDGSGYLSVSELTEAIHLYLNGVSRDQVAELVQRYDVDQDGTISVDEFSAFLMSRNSEDRSKWLTVDHLTSPKRKNSTRGAPRHVYEEEEDVSTSSRTGEGVDYRESLFLQTMKSALIKETLSRRDAGTIAKSERLGNKTSSLVQRESCAYIERLFAPLLKNIGGRRLIPLASFNRVLRRFATPGTGDVSDLVLERLFNRCRQDRDGRIIGEGASPTRLCELIFDEGGKVVDQFGFAHVVKAPSDTGRPKVAAGPLHHAKPINGVDSDLDKVTPHEISDVPFRFVTRRCRTSLAVPSNFKMSDVARSASLPDYDCRRDFVFGLKAAVTSGSPIHNYPLTASPGDGELSRKVIYGAGSLGVVHDLDTNRQTFFEGHDDDITCVAVAPGSFGLVATGQVGRRPSVCVWDCSCLPSLYEERVQGQESTHTYSVDDSGMVARLGAGFFMRAVCAVAFSYDAKYLCAIGCDDHHALGIWEIRTGELIAETSCHNGTPPQICSLSWCPCPQYATYVNKTHNGESDVICTTGVRHLKFWSFVRPDTVRNGQSNDMSFCSGTIGKVSVEKPKIFTCAAFLPPTTSSGISGGLCDLVTGGDNGYVFLFRKSGCVAVVDAFHRGVVSCMQVIGSLLVCGGSKGGIVQLNPSNLEVVQSYSVMPENTKGGGGTTDIIFGAPTPSARSKSSGGTTKRPVSAPRGRPGSVDGRGGAGGRARNEATEMSRKGRSKGPSSQWEGPRDHKKVDESLPNGVRPSTEVQGLVIIPSAGSGRYRQQGIDSILAVTGFGKLMEVNGRGGSPPIPLLSFHYGPTWAVAMCPTRNGLLSLTGGDDRWVCLWDLVSFSLAGRARAKAPVRCIGVDSVGSFIAVGMAGGAFSIFYLERSRPKQTATSLMRREETVTFTLHELATQRDCMEDLSDVKFSPNDKMVAVGSHDNFIDVYATNFIHPDLNTSASCNLRRLKRLRGHTSYITHLDWSDDNKYLQSTCGAYELLYWDVTTGKQALSSFDSLEADTTWYTSSCVLGFNVMGIWPKYSDGTDVNAVDVSRTKRVCITGDDSGYLNLFNYPCVTKDAPRKTYGGHSSHVMNVAFAPCRSADEEQALVTVGGHDNCIMAWSLV